MVRGVLSVGVSFFGERHVDKLQTSPAFVATYRDHDTSPLTRHEQSIDWFWHRLRRDDAFRL
jgi:hypothetical protein